jgi:hypothetical protein
MTLVEKEPVQVFYKNYDAYNTEGANGPAKQGPGTGFYSNIEKYKSVSDFRKKRRNKRKKIIEKLKGMKSVWQGKPK